MRAEAEGIEMGNAGATDDTWLVACVYVGFAAFMCLACGVYAYLVQRRHDGEQTPEQTIEPVLEPVIEPVLDSQMGQMGQNDWYCPVCLAVVRRDWPTVSPAATVARTCAVHRSLASAQALSYDRARYQAILRKPDIRFRGERYRVIFGSPLRSHQRN